MKFIKSFYKKIVPEKTRINIRFFLLKIFSFQYKGNNVTCNCCNKNFDLFLPYGDLEIKRQNAACPWCFSLERNRMLWDYLNKSTLLRANISVLHFAPEKSIEHILKNNRNIKYHGVAQRRDTVVFKSNRHR